MDIINMSTKQWYKHLMDQEMFLTKNEDGSLTTNLSRAEKIYSDVDWEVTWKRIRLLSFSSNTVSFLWKLVHDLLTTEERLNSTLGKCPATCRHGCPNGPIADQIHCFFHCSMTRNVGQWLLGIVQNFAPTNERNILKLCLPDNDALTWIVGNALHFSWLKRTSSVQADLPSCLAFLGAEVKVLKETKHHATANVINDIINLPFQP